MKKVLLVVGLMLTGCGGGAGARAPNTVLQQQQPAIVASAVLAAEAAGAIPVLDRTTSLLGTDANGNFVRDDIDAYINSLPDTPVQKKALMQYAAIFNAALATDLTQASAVSAIETKSMDATDCLFSVYSAEVAIKYSRDLEKYSINTKPRFDAYMKADQASSGHMLSSSSAGANCAP